MSRSASSRSNGEPGQTTGPRLRPGTEPASVFARFLGAVVILATAFLSQAACSGTTTPEELAEPLLKSFRRGSLTVESGEAEHRFSVYLANEPDELAQGLMFVKQMPDDAGMLFVYPRSRPVSMWMKNTVLPLDMLFIRADGTIESIVANTTPQSLRRISSQGNVRGVLELNAGLAARLGIQPGDRVVHPHFKRD